MSPNAHLKAKGESLPLVMKNSKCGTSDEQVLIGDERKSYGYAAVIDESTPRLVYSVDTTDEPVPLKVRCVLFFEFPLDLQIQNTFK